MEVGARRTSSFPTSPGDSCSAAPRTLADPTTTLSAPRGSSGRRLNTTATSSARLRESHLRGAAVHGGPTDSHAALRLRTVPSSASTLGTRSQGQHGARPGRGPRRPGFSNGVTPPEGDPTGSVGSTVAPPHRGGRPSREGKTVVWLLESRRNASSGTGSHGF